MEENVALDSTKQKKFVKSIRGIKKLIKKNDKKAEPPKKEEKTEPTQPTKPFSMRLKGGKVHKKKRKPRGLVYLAHIPHGFYEHQMTEYFKQFGVVTNVRVIRSKRTGNSKGFAFVEFKEPAVGQIVAETMNNYLMGKRLIKAAYIPPEKQRHNAFRKNWNNINNPTSNRRLKIKKAFNADKDEAGELKKARKLLTNLNKNKKKLSELGINYDFFAPVDVPEALLSEIVKEEKVEDNNSVKEEEKPKRGKKAKQEQTEDKKALKPEVKDSGKPQEVKGKSKNKKEDSKPVNASVVAKKDKPAEAKKENVQKGNKKDKKPVKVDEKQQKQKEQKLKDAGVKPAEFIKLDNEDSGDDSDGSDSDEYAFDSDEYDKMLEKMSENSELSFLSDEGDEESFDDDDDNEEHGDAGEEEEDDSDEEEAPPTKKAKGKPALKAIQPVSMKKQPPKPQAKKQPPPKPQAKKQEQKKPVEAKRKAPTKPVAAVSPKKPKFEKQSQKPMKKQFKKK